jgi:hypothetical protein
MNETTLTVLLTLKDQLSGGVAKAESELSGLASGGISTAGRALNSLESAAGHAKATLGGLAGSMLGQLGIGYGLMKISGFLEDAIGNTEQFGEAVLELHTLTGESAESLSGLAGAMQATGVSGEAAMKSLGMAFKMVGKMTSDQEIAFVTQYGMSLRTSAVSAQQLADAEAVLSDKTASTAAQAAALTTVNTYLAGSYKDTNDLVLQAADYYNSTASAEDKAAALSKEFGRGWQTLIPLFTQGSDGIAELEAQAKAMGLTITTENLPAIAQMKDASEKWNEAMSGLQLKIGLALLPQLTKFADAASGFVHDHGDEITGFFEGAADFAGELGDVLTNDVMPVLSTLAGWWGSIPKEFQELLIAAFVMQKGSSSLFGGGGIIGGLGGLLGGGSAAAAGTGVATAAGEGAVLSGSALTAAGTTAGIGIVGAIGLAAIAAAGVAAVAYVGWQQFGPGGTVDTANQNLSKTIAGYATKPTTAADDTGSLNALVKQYGAQTAPFGSAQLGPVSVPVPMSIIANLSGADAQAISAMTAAANKLVDRPMVDPGSVQAIRDAIAAAEDAAKGGDPGIIANLKQLRLDLAAVLPKPTGTQAQQDAAAKADAALIKKTDSETAVAIKGSASDQTTELTKLTALQRTLLATGDTKTAASIGADLEKLRTALGEINETTATLASKPYPPIFVTLNSDGSTAKDVSSAQTTRWNYKGTVAS